MRGIREEVSAWRQGRDLPFGHEDYLRASLAEGDVRKLGASIARTKIPSQSSLGSMVSWPAVATAARRFHIKAGSMTPAVAKGIELLAAAGTPVTRIAHTPDWLPYRSVALLPLVLDRITQNAPFECVQVFLSVDTDNARDRRLRVAEMPDRAGLSVELRTGLSRRSSERPLHRLPVPSQQVVGRIDDAIRRSLPKRSYSETRRREELLEELAGALDRAGSLAEANLIWLSRLVNVDWGLPTIFIPQSQYVQEFVPLIPELRGLVAALLDAAGKEKGTPLFWLVCHECGARTAEVSGSTPNIEAACAGCGREMSCDPESGADSPDLVVPRLWTDVALDHLVWNVALGLSYIGSSEHVVESLRALHHVKWSVAPDVLWQSVGFSALLCDRRAVGDNVKAWGHGEQRHWDGRATILYDFLGESRADVATAWSRHLDEKGLNAEFSRG